MGTFTITTPGAQDARIAAAFGRRLGLGRSATAAEIKQQVAQFVVEVVQEQEASIAAQAARDAVTLVTPT